MNKLKVLAGILTSISSIGYSGKLDQSSISTVNEPKIINVINDYEEITGGYCYFRIPIQVSNGLINCIDKIKEKYPDIIDKMEGWNTGDYLHATISFPMNISVNEAKKISNELEEVLKNQSPVAMELKSTIEIWHKRVVVAPIKITDELITLEKNILSVIRENLPNYTTKYGEVAYKPHITLGYIKRNLSDEIKEELSNNLPDLLTQEDFENTTWNANHFELGRSANNSGSYYLEPFVIYSLH